MVHRELTDDAYPDFIDPMSSERDPGPTVVMEPARRTPVVHLELHTGDLPRARDFCEELFGWPAERFDTPFGSYLALGIGDGVSGGIVQSPNRRPLWLPYVEVSHVGEMTARAHARGARVLLEPREGPAGWRSVIAVPGVGEIAFWHTKL